MCDISITFMNPVPSIDATTYIDRISIYGKAVAIEYAQYIMHNCVNVVNICVCDGLTGEVIWES